MPLPTRPQRYCDPASLVCVLPLLILNIIDFFSSHHSRFYTAFFLTIHDSVVFVRRCLYRFHLSFDRWRCLIGFPFLFLSISRRLSISCYQMIIFCLLTDGVSALRRRRRRKKGCCCGLAEGKQSLVSFATSNISPPSTHPYPLSLENEKQPHKRPTTTTREKIISLITNKNVTKHR